jgi:hypothetical protein
VVDDRDVVAEPVGLDHVVGRQQDRRARLAHLLDAIPEEEPRLRVQAGGGLVEEEDLRAVHERAGDEQPLGHAAREVVDVLVLAALQPERRHDLQRSPASLRAPVAEVGRVEREVLDRLELAIKVRALRYDGDALLHGHRVRLHVDAVDRGVAGRRAHASSARRSSSSCPRRSGPAARTPPRAAPGS